MTTERSHHHNQHIAVKALGTVELWNWTDHQIIFSNRESSVDKESKNRTSQVSPQILTSKQFSDDDNTRKSTMIFHKMTTICKLQKFALRHENWLS